MLKKSYLKMRYLTRNRLMFHRRDTLKVTIHLQVEKRVEFVVFK